MRSSCLVDQLDGETNNVDGQANDVNCETHDIHGKANDVNGKANNVDGKTAGYHDTRSNSRSALFRQYVLSN